MRAFMRATASSQRTRKIRYAGRGVAKGKSGANRVCYVLYPEFGTVALVAVFGKKEKADLSAVDRRAVAKMVDAFRDELRDVASRGRGRGPNDG